MYSLLLKDFYVITKQMKLMLVLVPVLSLSADPALSAMGVFFGAALTLSTIAFDERCGWDELAVMMPYSIKQLVVSKYAFGYACVLSTMCLGLVGQLVKQGLGYGFSPENLYLLLFSLVAALAFIAINLPILFKFGSEKGRIFFIVTMALISTSGPILKKLNLDPRHLLSFQNASPALILLLVVLLTCASVMLSIRIKQSKR